MKTEYIRSDCSFSQAAWDKKKVRLRPIAPMRLLQWLVRCLKRRRDATLLAAMSERELHDIGLYSHELPPAEAITPESRSSCGYIMMDGLPFPGASGACYDGRRSRRR